MPRPELTDAEAATALGLLRKRTALTPESALLHRLHCVVLVYAGWSSSRVAAAFGNDVRSVQRWVRHFRQEGAEGLVDAPHTGRRARLDAPGLEQLRQAVARAPAACGHQVPDWTPEVLRREILQRFGVDHSRRHCARLLAALRAVPPAGSVSAGAPPAASNTTRI